MIDITIQNFESELIQASTRAPVLLDIWAPWCGPCKSLSPVLEKLEREYAGRFTLAKLNSDEQPEIAGQLSQAFGVRSIPFCVLFDQGQPVDGFVGAQPEAQIRQFLDRHVPSSEDAQAEAQAEEAEALEAEADALFSEGEDANSVSDVYTLATLLFAAVLFFAAISERFEYLAMRATLLSLAGVGLLAGIVVTVGQPITSG
jgi:thioredoxin